MSENNNNAVQWFFFTFLFINTFFHFSFFTPDYVIKHRIMRCKLWVNKTWQARFAIWLRKLGLTKNRKRNINFVVDSWQLTITWLLSGTSSVRLSLSLFHFSFFVSFFIFSSLLNNVSFVSFLLFSLFLPFSHFVTLSLCHFVTLSLCFFFFTLVADV